VDGRDLVGFKIGVLVPKYESERSLFRCPSDPRTDFP